MDRTDHLVSEMVNRKDMMKKNRILITGGSGFLGINLIRFLRRRGIAGISTLDLNPFDFPEQEHVDSVAGDVRDAAAVDKLLEQNRYEIIVHAAAALPLYSRDDIVSTEVRGTENILRAAFNYGTKRVIYISSTAVYGIPDHSPVSEDDGLDGVGAYGEAKIEAEKICIRYRNKGLCVPIIRPKSFIGPERLGIFALLYEWANEGRSFPVIGTGNNFYQLLDVEDLCEAIWLTCSRPEEIVNDTFNIGAKEFATVREDYQAVLDRAGGGKKIVCIPSGLAVPLLTILHLLRLSPVYQWIYKTADKNSVVSTARAEKILDFRPKFSNQDALLRNYDWYVKNIPRFEKKRGVDHRSPWKQGVISVLKAFF